MPKEEKQHAVPSQTVQSSAIKHDVYSFPLDRNILCGLIATVRLPAEYRPQKTGLENEQPTFSEPSIHHENSFSV